MLYTIRITTFFMKVFSAGNHIDSNIFGFESISAHLFIFVCLFNVIPNLSLFVIVNTAGIFEHFQF